MGWIFSEMCRSTTRLNGKVAVVTGCNTGIGKETIAEFYKRGAKVIAACRNRAKIEEAIKDIEESTKELPNCGSFVIEELDLSSLESVRKCSARILLTEPSIHLLINNAGIMACPKQLSKDGYELQFASNHLGHFLLTLLLLPRIIKSAPARIVMVSSAAHRLGDGKLHLDDINLDNDYSPINAYSRSKTANILFARELGKRLKGTGVTTYSLHPGVINTELNRHLHNSYPWFAGLGVWLMRTFGKTPFQGAQTTLYCALDEKCANETGLFYTECAVAVPYYRARSDQRAAELWEGSLKLVNLENYDPFTPA